MLDIIANQFHQYKTALPRDILKAVSTSTLFSFFTATFISRDFNRGQIIGLVAATAALVDALTLPIFRQLFGDQAGYIAWEHHIVTIFVNLFMTQGIINAIGSSYQIRVDLMAATVMWAVMNIHFYGNKNHSTHHASSYILF